jgi:hypothetical protein
MKNITTKWYSIIAGTIFLLIILIVFIFIPCPTIPQLNFFRIFIAIAAGAFAATIPGAINFKNKIVAASGALGVLVLVYLVNPVGWKDADGCSIKAFKAIVYVDGQLTKDVEVTFPLLGKSASTDAFGSINVEYLDQQVRFPFKVIFKYKSVVDTIINLTAIDQAKMEFFLKSNTKINHTTSLSENSISFSYNEIDINMALLSPNKTDETYTYDDTVSYHFLNKGDTIFIKPSSRLIRLRESNAVIPNMDNYFCINLPQLDLKFTNNSNEAIFMNEIQMAVSASNPNNVAVIVPKGGGTISFLNEGWGNATDLKLDFNITPAKTYQTWKSEVYKHHYSFPVLKSDRTDLNVSVDENEDKPVEVDLRALLKQYGISEKAFEYGEQADLNNPNNAYTKLFRNAVGDYDKGGMAYGTLAYTDSDGRKKQMKFQSWFEISGGYGADMPEGQKYTTKFKTLGNDYLISTPVSQGLKPKDFDRFSLVFGANQASKHYFKMSFLYNSKKITLPYVFVLDYFNTPLGV